MGRDRRLTGTVKTMVMDRGFGFIRLDDSRDEYFFHQSGLSQGLKLEDLYQGVRVSFLAGVGPKGPRAESVELL
jgi:CspA family cold shock protein